VLADDERFQRSVTEFARTDFPKLDSGMSVAQALTIIREHGVGERLIYFYVVDTEGKLSGVLPTRRLLTSPVEAKLDEIMIRRVVALPQTATLLDACDIFVLHKFYALPVVDSNRHIVGIVDANVVTEELLDVTEKPDDTFFESLGFHLDQVRGASPWKAFRLRFPWLLTTIGSGTGAAILAGAFEETLARALILSFFLAMVLALAESVSIQSMTLTLQALRTMHPTWKWFLENARHEVGTGLLIGIASGLTVFLIAWIWREHVTSAGVIGGTIVGSLVIACSAGLAVPSTLHALKLDPKIAAGPITLALTDLATLLLYFSLAKAVL
jgi:magnesium transporter